MKGASVSEGVAFWRPLLAPGQSSSSLTISIPCPVASVYQELSLLISPSSAK